MRTGDRQPLRLWAADLWKMRSAVEDGDRRTIESMVRAAGGLSVHDRFGTSTIETQGALAYAIEPQELDVRLSPARRIDLLPHLAGAFDLAERQPAGHAARVAYLAYRVARGLGLDAGTLRRVSYAGLLHDAGIAVQPGDEHLDAGAWVADRFGLDEAVPDAIRATHERFDGRGRPYGRVGTEIPIEALCVIAAHWACEYSDQETNSLRARCTLEHAPIGNVEALAGPDVARSLVEVLHDDETWLALWDPNLPFIVALTGSRDEQPARGTTEAVAAAMGEVIDAAVREPGRAPRVSLLAATIAQQMQLAPNTCEAIAVAGHLLDIGQLGVPRGITDKPSILTVDEMEIMRRHPGVGARVLEQAPGFGTVAPWVEQHHERPDGRGYPEMLSIDELPLPPRILAVADAYWALRARRPYRPAFDEQEAIDLMSAGSGQQFDADVVDALPGALESIRCRVDKTE